MHGPHPAARDAAATEALLAIWRTEETGQPDGWDFSHVDGRMTNDLPPWDFAASCRAALTGTEHVLDMGTGGGEQLLSLRDALPADTVATEGWAPNLPVARAALEPLGIAVVDWGHDETDPALQPMPFADERFDVVLNRHESYDPVEIARVLRPGGLLLTQQVGGDELGELRALLGHRPQAPEVTYAAFRHAAARAGLVVEHGAEFVGRYRFPQVADLIAYLQRVPWDVPEDFAVAAYADQLLRLHDDGPARGRPVSLTCKRFWLRARKPAGWCPT